MRGNSAGWRRLRWLNHWQKLKYNRVRKLRVNRAKILNGSVWTKYPVKFFSQLEIRPVSYERSTWLQANTLSICNVSTNWHIVRAKRSKCIMQKWGLHEALPKRQFENIMVFFEAAIWDLPQLRGGRNCLKGTIPGQTFDDKYPPWKHTAWQMPRGRWMSLELTVKSSDSYEWLELKIKLRI